MRKLFFLAAIFAIAVPVKAQKPEDATEALDKKKLDKAKEIVDKLTADPNQKNAYAWLVKAQVYNTLATDDKYNAAIPDAYEQAFEAYKKAYELNPNEKFLMLDFYRTPFVAYEGIAGKAAKAYQENNFQSAFDNYKKVIDYGNYLRTKGLSYNGYSVPKIDTGMVFMAGYTAMKLENNEEALKYFKILADAKINSEADYAIPYQFLSYYYKSKKDGENLKKYDSLGKALYPNDPYFTTIMIDYARAVNDYDALFSAYEELIKMQPDTVDNYLSYASEMFNYLFKDSEKKPANFDELANKIEANARKALAANYEPFNANLILAQLFYNQGLDFVTEYDKIKASTKPNDVKKKTDLKAKAIARYDLSIPYAEKVANELAAKPTLKIQEKATLKNMYIMLGDMYTLKGDKAKAAEYDKKYEGVK
ncbi:MAG: hypothetical protein C4308_03065 [Chitinophagaceae bacterium]